MQIRIAAQRMKWIFPAWAVFACWLCAVIWVKPAFGDFRFADPNIPNGEATTYRSTSEGRTVFIKESITVAEKEGRPVYRVESLSPTLDAHIEIRRSDMRVVTVRTVQKYATATLDSTLKIVDQQDMNQNDAVEVPHFVALTHLLRGFPFESPQTVKIRYFGGAAKNKFTLSVKYKKKETITIATGRVECHKLEFGLDGMWGAMLPELELWYAVAPPHYLVRYVGPEGPPGTPSRHIELVEYRAQ